MNHLSKSLLLLASLVCMAGPAVAEGQKSAGQWTAGLIVSTENGHYAGIDSGATLLPYVSYDSARVHLSVTEGLAYHIRPAANPMADGTKLSVLLTPRLDPGLRTEGAFATLDRDMAFELGLRGRHNMRNLFGEAEVLGDISGVHNGYEASAAVGVGFALNQLQFEAKAGVRHRSKSLNQYMFGVSAAEATTTWTAYNTEATTTGFASLSGSYALTQNVILVGEFSFEDLGTMENSPIVDEATNSTLNLGVLYRF
ncbi:MipA/OmpV family protein [Thalassobius sp. MITS945101]|uniref:MipA/OmpV family protein n=1 Tax=Thalassobius sp. MITS945101 TaxID=3096994 RepID=UPI00399AB59C